MARAVWAALLAACAWGAAAGGAAAQEGDYLSGAEVRAAIIGRELSGVTTDSQTQWSECIDAAGATVYRYGDALRLIGRVEIDDDGLTCFSYEDTRFTNQSCWYMRRNGQRLQFDDAVGYGESFLVLARPRVNGCGPDAPVA